ncbi:hypothetical protein K8Z21_23830, partial [Bacillus thuringiensis]|nr:hypothetical protein [Bacillus thuringiensis]
MNNNTFIVSPSKFGVRREYFIPSLLLEQKKSLIVFDNNVNNSYEYTNKQKQEQGYLVFKYDVFDEELYIKLQQLLTDKNNQKYIFYIQQGAFTLNQEFRTKNGNEKMGELFRMILEGVPPHAHQLKNLHYPQVSKNVILSKKLARKDDI